MKYNGNKYSSNDSRLGMVKQSASMVKQPLNRVQYIQRGLWRIETNLMRNGARIKVIRLSTKD